MCQGITKKNKQCRNRSEPYCYLHVDQHPEVKAPEAKTHGEYPTDILNIIMDYHQGTKDDFKLKFNEVIAQLDLVNDNLAYLNKALEKLGLGNMQRTRYLRL